VSLWRQVTRGLSRALRPAAADRNVAHEVRHYLDEATADFEARGLTPSEARLAARRALGSETAIREQVRTFGWEYAVGSCFTDIRYGVRRLRATPGFTIVTVLTLAIGIGGATAIFSAVNPILFASLPYPHPGRIVSIVEQFANGSRTDGTFAMYRGFADRTTAFDAIAVFKPWRPTITGQGRPERLEGQRVSAGYFTVLGIAPIAGRDFAPSDDRPGGPNVVILGNDVWRRHFNADPAIVGQDVRLDDAPFTVIGIAPPQFENVTAQDAGVWSPLQYQTNFTANGREWGHHLKTIARLHDGMPLPQAAQQLESVGSRVIREFHPASYDPNTRFTLFPLGADLASGVKPALVVILGAVALILVIACVNVTSLLLARGVGRRGEFALRAALGAARLRLLRQTLTETLVLAFAGGLAGVLVAFWAVRGLVRLTPPGLPRSNAIAVDLPVLMFAAAITTVIGLGFGIVPALYSAVINPGEGLQQFSPRAAGGHSRMRCLLVVIEITLAVILLVGSGLLFRSLQRLFEVPLGFDSSRLLTMQVQAVGQQYRGEGAIQQLYSRQLDAVRHVPGVMAAGFSSQIPLSGERDEYGATFKATANMSQQTYGVFRYAVSPGYLEAARIPLRAGRMLDDHDVATAPYVALISESLAKARFGTRSPVGSAVSMGPGVVFTIVGVVGDVRQVSLAADNPQACYIPAPQSWFPDNPRSLIVRSRDNPTSLAGPVQQAIWSVDKDQPIARVATMDALVKTSEAQRRFALILFEAFGVTALTLAAIGIYGVLAGSVSERTREIGVRAALGASRREIVGMILRQGMTVTGVGVAIGLIAAALASRALITLLFGISRLDPVTYAFVVVLLLATSLGACALPAWRAARVDPSTTLRSE
jgi:putative ABC transport system permease protein